MSGTSPSPLMSSFAGDAIKAALAYGDDATMDRTGQRCVAWKRTAMVFLPALLVGIALVVLPLALKVNLLQNSQLAAGLWYGLICAAFCSHVSGYMLDDGVMYEPVAADWFGSENARWLRLSPGANQVMGAVVENGRTLRWAHRELMERVYHQERKIGMFVEPGKILHWKL